MNSNIRELVEEMVRRDASDLYITVDAPPMYRVEGITSPWGEDIFPRKKPKQWPFRS